MSTHYLFHAGEATVFARDGQFTDAMPEILIGRTDGPVGHAFAAMMAQSKGHTAMFAIRACNQLVRPATIVVPKVTLKDVANIDLFGGVVQSATNGPPWRARSRASSCQNTPASAIAGTTVDAMRGAAPANTTLPRRML